MERRPDQNGGRVVKSTYIVVPDWAAEDLGLTGNDLLVYSLIYGFCQDGRSGFRGSISYIEKRLGLSRRSVIYILDRLVKNGHLFKSQDGEPGKVVVTYQVNFVELEEANELVQNIHWGSAKSALGWCKNCTETSAKFAPNNKYKNKIENKADIYTGARKNQFYSGKKKVKKSTVGFDASYDLEAIKERVARNTEIFN